MKRLAYLAIVVMAIAGMSCKDSTTSSGGGCGSHNGKTLHLGPQGGCYYENDNGNKVYVDRSECNC